MSSQPLNIPVARPKMAEQSNVDPYLKRMHQSGIFTNYGPLVQELELRYSEHLNVRPEQVVITSSGTQALFSLASVMDPSRWIVPDWTFTATGLAVMQSGKDLLFQDVDQKSWRLGIFSKKTEYGYVIVAPFGGKIGLTDLPARSFVIVDAAASLGSKEDLSGLQENQSVMFSLHATKVLGCGEGGIAVCGSTEVAERVRRNINFGFWGDRISLINSTNGKMAEMQAAYALAALDGWIDEQHDWSITHDACHQLSEEYKLDTGPTALDGRNPYWIVDFHSSSAREHVEKVLSEHLVGTKRWWPVPLSDMPAFVNVRHDNAPNSRLLSTTTLGLPCYRGLSDQDVSRISLALRRALNEMPTS